MESLRRHGKLVGAMMGFWRWCSVHVMYDQSLKATDVDAMMGRVAVGHPEYRRNPGWHRFFRPSSLGCLGLALTIFLWGYSYKLSLYRTHRDTASRSLAARLWVDQRHATGLAALRVRVEADPNGQSDALDAKTLHLFDLTCACTQVAAPARNRRLCFSKSLLPLRSPPSSPFSA